MGGQALAGQLTSLALRLTSWLTGSSGERARESDQQTLIVSSSFCCLVSTRDFHANELGESLAPSTTFTFATQWLGASWQRVGLEMGASCESARCIGEKITMSSHYVNSLCRYNINNNNNNKNGLTPAICIRRFLWQEYIMTREREYYASNEHNRFCWTEGALIQSHTNLQRMFQCLHSLSLCWVRYCWNSESKGELFFSVYTLYFIFIVATLACDT